jgi:hypothetical protein
MVNGGLIPEKELDYLVKVRGYTHLENWRTDPATKQLAAEEWLAQRMEKMQRIPQGGPMGRVMDWLRDVWEWLTGERTDDLAKLKMMMREMHRALGALEPGQRILGEQIRPSYIGEKAQMSQFMRDSLDTAKAMAAAGLATLDEHGIPIDGEDAPAIAQGAVKRVAQDSLKKAAGQAPEFVQKQLDAMNNAKLPWKSLLRNAIMKQVTRETKATNKKINRRFALPVPGKKQKRTMTLGVCVDSSGSVSDQAFGDFLSEVQSIAKQVTRTWLIHADCEVQAIEDLSKKPLERVRKGNGGTAYQPAINKCLELKCDMIIYFGDFDCADKPKNPGKPFIWVGVGDQEPPGNFGKVIRL